MNFHPTQNNLPSNTKSTICSLLNVRVADAIDLALMTKQANWNLRGATFIAVHECWTVFARISMAMLTTWPSVSSSLEVSHWAAARS